jgi:hypothetical protein
MATLMSLAFGVIAALAWNSAISALIAKYMTAGDGWIGLMIYAVIITIVAVLAIIFIARVAAKAKASDLKAEGQTKK